MLTAGNSLQLLNAVCETESWARCGGSLVLLRSSCVGMAPFSYVARGARLLRQMRCAHPSSAGYCHSPTSTVGRTVTENCIHRARHRSPRIAALAPSLPFSAPGLGVIESHNGRIWVTRGRLDSRCANSSPGPGWSIGEFRFRNAEVRIRPSSANITNASHMKVAQKPRDRSAASGDLMKTLLGRVYLANALSCVHLQGETVSCG